MNTPAIGTLRWLRVIGDTIFGMGTIGLAWFIFGLKGGWSIVKNEVHQSELDCLKCLE